MDDKYIHRAKYLTLENIKEVQTMFRFYNGNYGFRKGSNIKHIIPHQPIYHNTIEDMVENNNYTLDNCCIYDKYYKIDGYCDNYEDTRECIDDDIYRLNYQNRKQNKKSIARIKTIRDGDYGSK